jgi:hypothetical protein
MIGPALDVSALEPFHSQETAMSDESKPAKPLEEKQATVPGVEMENDECGVPTEADQSDDTDAKGAPKR